MIYRSQAAKCGILGTLNCLEKESLDHPNTIINCLYEHWPESPLSFLMFGSAVLAHSSIGLFILPHHIFIFHLHTQSELSDACMWHAHVCERERRVCAGRVFEEQNVGAVGSLTSHQFPKDMQQAVNTRCATADLWLHWSGFKPALFESEMHSGANNTHCAQTSAWRGLGFWGGTFWNAKSWNDLCIQNC